MCSDINVTFVKFNDKEFFLLSSENKDDKEVLFHSDDRYLIKFTNKKDAEEFMESNYNHILWSDDPIIFNYSAFLSELDNLQIDTLSSTSSCDVLLEGWNFLEVFLYTFRDELNLSSLNSNIMDTIYKKFFRGANIPSLMDNDKEVYHPTWEQDEIFILRSNMQEICKAFINKI